MPGALDPPTGPARHGAGAPWLAPVLAGGAAVSAVVTVAVLDPNVAGHYPTCPFLAVTGLWCPGCGSLRAIHALAHGDVVGAVDLNVLTVVLLLLLVVAWVGWLRYRLGRRAGLPGLPTWAGAAVAVAIPVFGVLRNLPVGGVLAP